MIKGKVEELETLLEISKAIFSTLETKEILYLIVKKLSEIMNVTRCSIILTDLETNIGQILSTYEDPALVDISIDLTKYPEIIKAIEDKKMILVQDVRTDPLMKGVQNALQRIGIRCIMVIPIRYSEEVAGALYLRTSRRGKRFSDKEIKVCQIISSMAGIALRNAQLFNFIKEEKTLLEKMAVTDDMTRLYNHRYFVKRLNEEFKRAQRYDTPLSCAMIDLDDFKRINDTYGHKSGDIILQEVARVIKNSVRETDVVARYGGEEFAVILPHTNSEDAFSLAARIRSAVNSFRSDILEGDKPVTVSIGVSTYPDSGVKDVDDLVRRADNGLYKAKGQGKNTVVSL